ncbi:MAG: GNAT family N-acetyltransferase [Xanthobacteraceae bacterium]|nr:GNAT family N-acetyltransferase [Xanthobacteraceae bacterium]
MTFRPAKKEDASSLAEFVNYAGHGMPLYLWGKLAKAGEDPWSIGRARAAREEGAFSYRNTTVIECDGECAGCLIGYAIPERPEHIPLDMPRMFVPLQELENLAPSTWYINVVGVHPRFRNRGLGAKLLALADETARSQHLPATSLIVADSNHDARRLYHRYGMRERAARKAVTEDWDTDTENWILMVKELSS